MAPPRRSVVELVRERVVDAELGALLWLLVETRLPVIVVGPDGAGRTTLRDALLDLLPPDARSIRLAGDEEDFEWLPEAPELGWRRERRGQAAAPHHVRASSTTAVLLADGLGDRSAGGTAGSRARVVIRALALGYGMAATMIGTGLEDVLDTLGAVPIAADDDELSRLGIVLVLAAVPGALDEPADREHVVAAHYVRPVVRDAHGHVQRLPPAVLAAWDQRTDRLEHFAWGIVGELAGRTGRRPVEFEREQARRAGFLASLVEAGIADPEAVRTAIAHYRRTS